MKQLNNLEPASLWQFFYQIAAIPHTSYHEQALIEWLKQWANKKRLKVWQDKVGNLIIAKPASPGMENRKGVILQAHLDMVAQKEASSKHDFLSDAIELMIEGGWLTAKGTTLGADNGIGMAAALAVLDASDIPHGPLEVLLTINEEAGMDGAFGLEPGLLQGQLLINTDSEQEGEIFMGCAGGGDTQVSFNADCQAVPEHYISADIKIAGLKGGHSGCDINSGRANANILMARLLALLTASTELNIVSIDGGSLRNAIPRDAHALIVFAPELLSTIETKIAQYQTELKQELGLIETELSIQIFKRCEPVPHCLEKEFQRSFIKAFNAAPNGVRQMSGLIEGVVESSLNLGIVSTELKPTGEASIELQFLCRSLIDDSRIAQEQALYALFSELGAEVVSSNDYPGWQPQPDSGLIQVLKSSFEQLFNKSPKLMVIHAGLECGLIQRAYPDCEMVSIGPTIKYPHSPDEKVDIQCVASFWQWLRLILANIPER